MNKQEINLKQGFTLVELIVVITILAILGTIAFISLEGYSKSSRDSVRISDISSIKSSFELFYNDTGKYPETTGGTIIDYIGYDAWKQGVVGDSTIKNLDRLDKIPKDPLTEREYTYSVTTNKQEYQLAGIYEGEGFSYNKIVTEGYAALTLEMRSFVVGNYNGKILQVKGGGNIYILAVPTIISNDLSDGNLLSIVSGNKLVFNNYKNLPANYVNSKYLVNGEVDLNLINVGNIEIFSGLLDELKEEANQVSLINGLQKAYTGTVIITNYAIAEILSYNIDNNSEGTKFLAQTILHNTVSNSVEIKADNVDYSYNCDGLIGNNPGYNPYNLCNNIELNGINNIVTSTNLTNNSGNRDVYAVGLEGGKEYIFETLGDDYGLDTHMSLYDNNGNLLISNDDISGSIYRSKFTYPSTYTGYYYIGIMGYDDVGTDKDYTLGITKVGSCSTQPAYTNANFIDGVSGIDGKIWQNTDSNSGCYYSCTNGYIGNDCSVLSACMSDLTETDKNNLNTFFNGYGYNGDITYWCSLQVLDVWNTGISGIIPSEIGKLSNLEALWLDGNSLTGSIPAELGNLSNLNDLWLSGNSLTGSIPTELGNLSNLNDLWLNGNTLTGTIPISLGSLSNLKKLILKDNQLTGNIPVELGNLTSLETLSLYNNQLTGNIPVELGNLTSLETLSLYNNQLTGNIPSEIGNLSNLTYLWLEQNQLTGSIPPELGNLSNLGSLILNGNQLTGIIPPELGNLIALNELWLSGNYLTGSIPPELGNLTNLHKLWLYSNYLTGTIPAELGNLNQISDLRLNNNKFTGAEQGYCDLINSITGWSSPSYNGVYIDNLQDSDNDGNYDNEVIFCP